MINNKTIEKFREIETPFYYYDLDVLRSTLDVVKKEYVEAELRRREKILKKYVQLRVVMGDLDRISKLQYICVLFGSYAKGVPKTDSDVDLLFIIPKEYDYGTFEILTRNAFITGNVDVNIGFDESLHEMWSTPLKLNVGNELLKGHIVLRGAEAFLEARRKHYVG